MRHFLALRGRAMAQLDSIGEDGPAAEAEAEAEADAAAEEEVACGEPEVAGAIPVVARA